METKVDLVFDKETRRWRKRQKPGPKPVHKSKSPCKKGKVRSPKTGRCRKSKSPGRKRSPCKPGMYRKKSTGRCSPICAPGKIRDKVSGRCRTKKSPGRPSTKPSCPENQTFDKNLEMCRDKLKTGRQTGKFFHTEDLVEIKEGELPNGRQFYRLEFENGDVEFAFLDTLDSKQRKMYRSLFEDTVNDVFEDASDSIM